MINIKIQNNRIAVDNYPTLSAGAVNDFEITFRFVDNGWDNLTKIAVFTAGTTAVRVALENDTCFIPADVLEVSGDLTIGVYGYEMGENEEVALRKSPTPLEISVWSGSYNKDATDPTPEQVDICEQALLTAQTANATAQSVRDDADAGVFDGEDGVSVTNANIDEYGDLIMRMSNGENINAGNVLPALQNKTITPSEIPQTAVADDGYYALGSVSVEPIEIEELTVTENGDYTAPSGKYYKNVGVNVEVNELFYSNDGRQYTNSITIPDTVTSIASYAYQNCTNLTSITIPDTVTNIGYCAFQGCAFPLYQTEFVAKNASLEMNVFGAEKLTSSTIRYVECKNLGAGALEQLSNVEEIKINEGATTIGAAACRLLKKITTLFLPSTITSTNATAGNGGSFYECTALKNITLANGFLATVNFSVSTQFTAEDMISMFNSLGTVPDGETRTFTLGATNLAKLTAEQKAIATDKNWTLA